jgi:ribonuclease BN (tRNA processing enzyme)
MEITVVGSGTVVPRLEEAAELHRGSSSGETARLRPGIWRVRGMVRAGLDPFAVDRIFFTHFHPDHTVDAVPCSSVSTTGPKWSAAVPFT